MAVAGNEDDLNEAIGFLKKIGDGMLDIYETHANEGVTRDSIWDAMVAETWLNPKEASAMFKNVKETDAKYAVAAEACSYASAPEAVKKMVFSEALKAIEGSRGIGE